MKVVIAPDSFKGSLTALQVAEAIERGFKRIFPDAEYQRVPMADGGEGIVQSLVDATGGEVLCQSVAGPLGDRVEAKYGILGDGKTAAVEMAAASGLTLLTKERRNPMLTTTYGTGELIKAALGKGCRKLIIGIGGSATNDGGSGMAQALGAKLLNSKGEQVAFGGYGLGELKRIDISGLDLRLGQTEVVVACDVDNPLIGERGASKIYGPQKGATPEMVDLLDRYLGKYAEIIERDLKKEVKDVPGAGAAGGLGAGLIAFLNAKLRSGIEIVIEASGLEEKVKSADIVITGEGEVNHQTIFGKTPIGVARVAKRFEIPVVAIAGGIAPGAESVYDGGIDAIMSIVPGPISLEEAMCMAEELVASAAERAARMIKVGAILRAEKRKGEGRKSL